MTWHIFIVHPVVIVMVMLTMSVIISMMWCEMRSKAIMWVITVVHDIWVSMIEVLVEWCLIYIKRNVSVVRVVVII